jgi:hypothetical protein
MNWNWHLTDSGTLQIFNDTALYWEIDGCNNYTKQQQKEIAQEFIKDYKEWIKE